MGLDTTHDCWHGAYSAFMRWREKLAKVAGFPPLGLMEGYCEINGVFDSDERSAIIKRVYHPMRDGLDNEVPTTEHAYMVIKALGSYSLPIKWDYFRKDPLSTLLDHSDCKGRLKWCDCKPLALRLKELLPALSSLDIDLDHIGDWKKKTEQFIEGLMLAHSLGEDVIFR